MLRGEAVLHQRIGRCTHRLRGAAEPVMGARDADGIGDPFASLSKWLSASSGLCSDCRAIQPARNSASMKAAPESASSAGVEAN